MCPQTTPFFFEQDSWRNTIIWYKVRTEADPVEKVRQEAPKQERRTKGGRKAMTKLSDKEIEKTVSVPMMVGFPSNDEFRG